MASGGFFKRPGAVLFAGLVAIGGLVSLAERLVSLRGSTENAPSWRISRSREVAPRFRRMAGKWHFAPAPQTAGRGISGSQ